MLGNSDKPCGPCRERGVAETSGTQNGPNPSRDPAFQGFVIDSLPVAVIVLNADFKISGFNPAAERITGYTASEAMGQFCGDVLRCGMCSVHCPLRSAVKGRKPVSLVETTIHKKSGEIIPVQMNTAGLFDESGCLIGGVESFQDISRLKSLEREKDNLISMFAHDMKSALTIIGGYVLRLLKKRDAIDQEKEKQYLEIIKSQSGKLEELVDNFLEFSRLQTGELKLNLTATSLDKELMDVVDSFRLKASESGIQIELQNEDVLPLIRADAQHLRRVFTNLIDNALKYSDEGTTVTVSTHETPTHVIVKVSDEGHGMPQEELPFVFDAFHRGVGTQKKGGFGLGLAGVKAIVDAHGGRVRVKSEPGEGSTFIVTLPKTGHEQSREEGDRGFP